MDRMFDKDSFDDLQSAGEVKQAVEYLAHNETKFREELASEDLPYEEVQKEVGQIWINLLKLCSKFKYSDYLVVAKNKLYASK
jgi:hypothetical protein